MNDHQKGLYAFVVISFLIRIIVFTYEVLIVLRNAQTAHNGMTHREIWHLTFVLSHVAHEWCSIKSKANNTPLTHLFSFCYAFTQVEAPCILLMLNWYLPVNLNQNWTLNNILFMKLWTAIFYPIAFLA